MSDLIDILANLELNEIGFLIESVPCTGFTVRLGDEMNGYLETASIKDAGEIVPFLKAAIRKHYTSCDADKDDP